MKKIDINLGKCIGNLRVRSVSTAVSGNIQQAAVSSPRIATFFIPPLHFFHAMKSVQATEIPPSPPPPKLSPRLRQFPFALNRGGTKNWA